MSRMLVRCRSPSERTLTKSPKGRDHFCEPVHDKRIVERYIDGFNKTDHEQILSCLTDDIEWTVFGRFRITDKEAYDANIEGPDPAGVPRK